MKISAYSPVSRQPRAVSRKPQNPDEVLYYSAGKPVTVAQREQQLKVQAEERRLREQANRQYTKDCVRSTVMGASLGGALAAIGGSILNLPGGPLIQVALGALVGGRLGLGLEAEFQKG